MKLPGECVEGRDLESGKAEWGYCGCGGDRVGWRENGGRGE